MISALQTISDTLSSEAQAQSVLAALVAAGWIVVPRIPTQDMLDAAWAATLAENAREVWDEMIGAVTQ